MSNEADPTGWVAWRNGAGFEIHNDDETPTKGPRMSVYLREGDLDYLKEHKGWSIRPCKIVFTDEPQSDGWIKCSERLPTNNPKGVPPDSIMAFGVNPERYHKWKEKFGEGLEHKEQFIACYVPQFGFLKNGVYFRDESQRGFVTHWRPLTANPKEEV